MARSAYYSTILNCINHSFIRTSAEYLSGLVSGLHSASKMIGCINKGNLENLCSWDTSMKVGGLVADMSNDALIEACYNTGNIRADRANVAFKHYFGGLVAYMNNYDETNASEGMINACWSSGTFVSDWIESWFVDNLVAWGGVTNCYWVEKVPTEDQLKTMNQGLTNTYFEFDTTTGGIVAKKPAVSLPEFDIEDF